MTSLILLSGNNEEEANTMRQRACMIAADRLLGSDRLRRVVRRAKRGARPSGAVHSLARRHYRAIQNEAFLGAGFFKRMVRKAGNVTKQVAHVGLQTARGAAEVSKGDFGGALSRIGSTISNVTGKGGSSSAPTVVDNSIQGKVKGLFSGWKGYAITGGGFFSILLITILVLKKKG